jgi:hypothetical protein
MRRILAASALLLSVSAATPGMAAGYPWCAARPNTGAVLDCRYTSMAQCQATANVLGVSCYQNPARAHGQMPRTVRNGSPRANGWQDDDWQNNGAWDNRRW